MRIGIIGAGALGLYYGAMLQRAGHEVRFLLRRDFAAINRAGLRVFSVKGDFELPRVKAFDAASQIGKVDLVLIGLKTFSNHQLVDLVQPLIGANTAILTLQNGLGNEELLAASFGAERVLGGVAFLCSNRGAPGEVHHLGEGRILLGEYAGGLTVRSKKLAELFCTAGVPCEASDDLLRIRWEKLVWNIPFNGLCTLTGQTVSDLLEFPLTRQLVTRMMAEVIDAANLHPLATPIACEPFIAQLLKISDAMSGYQPSMMIDRAEGRPLELAAIYKIPLQRAADVGATTPQVDMLYRCLAIGEKSS